MKNRQSHIEQLKEIIQKEVVVYQRDKKIVSPRGEASNWLFDFRKIFLKPDPLDLAAQIFWDQFESEYPFQVGGQETAAIPLVTAIVMKSKSLGKPVNGFYIRKSRKKDGLQQIIEGEMNERKIIIIDDLINSGKTIARQVEVLERFGKKPAHIFCIVGFRSPVEYEFLKQKGLTLSILFSLNDFGLALGEKPTPISQNPFRVVWYFQSSEQNLFTVIPKSAPIVDEEKIYFGSDNGNFWALNQADGSIAWQFEVGWSRRGKFIFSTPVLYGATVYFGAYDGNVYALNRADGKKKWIFREADWVESSPAVAPELDLLFIGLQFGLWRKRGGVAALDLDTGEKKWEYRTTYRVSASPAHSPQKRVVAVGDDLGTVHLLESNSGKLCWIFKTEGSLTGSFVFDEKRNLILFGSTDGYLYGLDVNSGKLSIKYQTQGPIFSTPLLWHDIVFFGSLDKKIYALDLNKSKLIWEFMSDRRVFASPVIVQDHLYIGSNDGRLYEIDPLNGILLNYFQTTERITNRITYNPVTGRIFVPTYANEIFCIERHK